MQKITIGIMGQSENFGRDDGIEEALWRSFKDLILKDNEVVLNQTAKLELLHEASIKTLPLISSFFFFMCVQ